MAALPAYKVAEFIAKLVAKPSDSPYRLFLLYGPEIGLSSERQAAITTALVPDKDPFRLVVVSQDSLLHDPARFFDEMLAISFGGEKKLLVVTEVDDRLYEKILADFFQQMVGENYLLLVSANLGKTSSLRRAVESSAVAVALPAYQDDERTILQLLNEQLKIYGITIDNSTKTWLSQQLGGNRLETKRIIEQICLYGMDSKNLTFDDVRPLVNVGYETVDKFINAVLVKDASQLLLLQEKLQIEKVEPLLLIRRMMMEINRLQNIWAEIDQGVASDTAIERQVPFFKHRPVVKRALSLFKKEKLFFWRGKLLELENQLKSSLPPILLTERLFLQMVKTRY